MIYMGTKELKALYRGTTAIKAVWSGERKIWPTKKPAAGEKVNFAGRDWWICDANYTTNEIFLLMVSASAVGTAWASSNQGTNHWGYSNILLKSRDTTLSNALTTTQKGFLKVHSVQDEYSDMKVKNSDDLTAMINKLVKKTGTSNYTNQYIFTLSLEEFRDYVNGKSWADIPATSAVWPNVWYLHTGFTCYSARDNNREVYVSSGGPAGGYAYCNVAYGNDRQGCIVDWEATGDDHWGWNDGESKWYLA